MKKIKIQWDKKPTVSFRQAIKYIAKDSPQNADKVKTEIVTKINQLFQHP